MEIANMMKRLENFINKNEEFVKNMETNVEEQMKKIKNRHEVIKIAKKDYEQMKTGLDTAKKISKNYFGEDFQIETEIKKPRYYVETSDEESDNEVIIVEQKKGMGKKTCKFCENTIPSKLRICKFCKKHTY